MALSQVLAHQGGWDEIVMVAVPVAVFGLLLLVARRRAEHIAAERTGPSNDRDAGP